MALEKPVAIPPRWEDGLSEDGRRLLQQARLERIPGASALIAQGFVAVGEVLSNSGMLVWKGPKERVADYRSTVAYDEISRLQREDMRLGRRRVYRSTDGAVVPLKRFMESPDGVTERRQLRADSHGLTIWARDIQMGRLAAAEVAAPSIVELVRAIPAQVTAPTPVVFSS